jgi:hypothetical protein
MKEEGVSLNSYHYQSFIDLRSFVELAASLYDSTDLDDLLSSLPEPVVSFLNESKLNIKISKLINNTSNQHTFIKALYQLFDAFQLMKYLHFTREHYYADDNVLTLASEALQLFNYPEVEGHQLLSVYKSLNLSLG